MAKFIIEAAKKELLHILQTNGVTDGRVLAAIEAVPREEFVHEAFRKRAYADMSLPIGSNQTISQPTTVAIMTELLEVAPGMSVLEIGTGSGYQAAVLAAMGAFVTTIERHEPLHFTSQTLLARLGYSTIKCVLEDGTHGYPKNAPYHRIIVTAGAPDIPKEIARQLAIGGKMVVPVGDRDTQKMHIIIRNAEEDFDVFVNNDKFRFVPLVGEYGWRNPVTSTNN
ncbi:MAG: protein-L-isoaspartate(D-aspartate) O-methyltransferase [Candidatus Kapabacteria bacterium]|nr:protein-L-isoaspartate(D-aspartate) O-methyltransferase [Candidatus Kapabacteria bacterium]